jgi:hypothetical protein
LKTKRLCSSMNVVWCSQQSKARTQSTFVNTDKTPDSCRSSDRILPGWCVVNDVAMKLTSPWQLRNAELPSNGLTSSDEADTKATSAALLQVRMTSRFWTGDL